MGSVRKSLVLSFAVSYVVMSIQFVSTLVLSRLLTPAQIGVFSVAAVLAALASAIRDFGVSEYLVQEKNLTADKIRAAFTLNLIVSWSMGAALLLLRAPSAHFYREPGLADVVTVLACNFLFIPFGAVTMAYFRRELNFAPLFWIGVISTTVSQTVAIALALAGFGYMSLAWSSLAGTVSTVMIVSVLRPKELPLLPGLKAIRGAFSFGLNASGIYILAQVGKGAPDLIIGRAISMEAVGLFSRANGPIEIFYRSIATGIMRVALPYFSAEQRSGQDVKRGLLKAVSYITGVGWPFFALLAVLAYPTIRIIYGAQWGGAVLPLQLLCGAFAVQLAYYMSQEVLIAVGRVGRGAMLQAQTLAVRIIFMLVAAPFGLIAICSALLLASAVTAAISHRELRSVLKLSVADMAASCAPSALLTVAAALPAITVVLLMNIGEDGYVLPFLLASAAAAASWLAAVLLLRHPLAAELKLLWTQVRRRLTSSA